GKIVKLPQRPSHTSAEVVLLRIREVLARETATAWGVRKVWATLRREGLKVSRRRVHAIMRAYGLVLARARGTRRRSSSGSGSTAGRSGTPPGTTRISRGEAARRPSLAGATTRNLLAAPNTST